MLEVQLRDEIIEIDPREELTSQEIEVLLYEIGIDFSTYYPLQEDENVK